MRNRPTDSANTNKFTKAAIKLLQHILNISPANLALTSPSVLKAMIISLWLLENADNITEHFPASNEQKPPNLVIAFVFLLAKWPTGTALPHLEYVHFMSRFQLSLQNLSQIKWTVQFMAKLAAQSSNPHCATLYTPLLINIWPHINKYNPRQMPEILGIKTRYFTLLKKALLNTPDQSLKILPKIPLDLPLIYNPATLCRDIIQAMLLTESTSSQKNIIQNISLNHLKYGLSPKNLSSFLLNTSLYTQSRPKDNAINIRLL